MSVKKKNTHILGDRTWSVVNFDRNAMCQRNDPVSIETVSEEGLCDDVLSTTSSDESDAPVGALNNLNEVQATGFGFDTLVEQNEPSVNLANTLSQAADLKIPSNSTHSCVRERAARTLSQLNSWQIVLLTSSTTFLITCALQSVLKSPSAVPLDETATAPYFTNHGATYRNVDFVLPAGNPHERAGKFIVDFENCVAYPVVPEVSFWESAKFNVGQMAKAFRSHIKELDKSSLQKAKDRVHSRTDAMWSTINTSLKSWSSNLKEASVNMKIRNKAMMTQSRDQLTKCMRNAEKAFQVQYSNHLAPLRDKVFSHVLEMKSALGNIGPLTSRFNSALPGAASGVGRFRERTGSILYDKWDNTMEMLRFERSGIDQ
ncbi:LAME_0F00892g1_1 [Lachancea meyersii CBS 8951]|uniref:LAME_0F00892g1_1 n=1 Tax=Lachancea meyersii CBS 8951 TaxID=1266667 RepID=A0A1G4JPI7_9SACH|nr:LAME_0F00892g1_1 [Lachancea meyersii CBS 8951]